MPWSYNLELLSVIHNEVNVVINACANVRSIPRKSVTRPRTVLSYSTTPDVLVAHVNFFAIPTNEQPRSDTWDDGSGPVGVSGTRMRRATAWCGKLSRSYFFLGGGDSQLCRGTRNRVCRSKHQGVETKYH